MFIETYIAIAMLVVLVPVALWIQGKRNDAEWEAQIAEDTCDKHGVFCCEKCFDMSIVS